MTIVLRLLITALFCTLLQQTSKSQIDSNSGSENYEQQRQRVNKLLEDRRKRFGDFELSTEKKSGILGIFKTKKDRQKSIKILQDIVVTDNHILNETRKLLEIKNYESNRHETLALTYDAQVTAHMRTISKLRQENNKLAAELKETTVKKRKSSFLLYMASGLLLLVALYALKLYKHNNRKI